MKYHFYNQCRIPSSLFEDSIERREARHVGHVTTGSGSRRPPGAGRKDLRHGRKLCSADCAAELLEAIMQTT